MYVVICYSVHEQEIASYDAFENERDAVIFLKEDAQDTYEEEMNNSDDESKTQIYFTMRDDRTAYLSSCDGECEWTWEIIKIK